MIYFDNAATTFVREEARAALLDALESCCGNPSSTHAPGRAARELLAASREKVARALGADPGDVVFTSGGTEADNWAIFSAAELMRRGGRHIVSSAVEHDAVLKPLKKLESMGWEVTYLAPDASGRITEEAVAAAVRPDTALVSVMMVNNETGAVNPVERIAKAVRSVSPDALVHTDAVQAFCKVPFSAGKLGADLISISGHKIHGVKGVGALWIRNGLKLPPMIYGGGQEGERRSGTEAMPAIAAFGEAARLGREELAENAESMRAVGRRILERLDGYGLEYVRISVGDAPHILSISLPGYKSEVILNLLDAEGICVSKSSACKRGRRSHVLEAMGLPARVIDGAIRLSFSRYSTLEEADIFAERLNAAAGRLLKVL